MMNELGKYIHTHIQTHTYMNITHSMNTNTDTLRHRCTWIHPTPWTQTHTLIHTHTWTYPTPWTQTHTQTHMYMNIPYSMSTNTHTQTRMHTFVFEDELKNSYDIRSAIVDFFDQSDRDVVYNLFFFLYFSIWHDSLAFYPGLLWVVWGLSWSLCSLLFL